MRETLETKLLHCISQ